MTRVDKSTSFETSGTAEIDAGALLMMRIRDGDSEAFSELVDRYQLVVLNAAYRYIGNRAVAEELTQDVFVRLFRARETYQRKAKFETWLFRIVFNLCANAADYGKRRRTVSMNRDGRGQDETSEIVLGDPEAATPLEGMERSELREQVRKAIERLPDQQRAALIMSRYQDMPYQDIAEALDTSVEAIKSLLFRARDNLRQILLPYLREEVRDEN